MTGHWVDRHEKLSDMTWMKIPSKQHEDRER